MNLLPLDAFRRILKYPPYQFWGLDNAAVKLDSQCNGVVYEHTYQNSGVGGRDDIREALILAQEKLRNFLQYPIAPEYREETMAYPTYLDQRLIRSFPIQAGGGWLSVFTPDGYLQAIGVESLTAIEDTPVVYSDEFGTGVDDTFTLSFITTETDPDKIAIYFAEADRVDEEPVSEKYRIEPIQVQIEAGTATVIGRSWLLVKPILYQAIKRQIPLDPSTAANFVTEVSAYIRTTDPNGNTVETSQGAFVWDSIPGYGWWGFCCASSTDPASVARAIARVGIADSQLGLVIPGEAVYNETDLEWHQTVPPWSGICRPPQQVTIRYLAGKPLTNRQVDTRLANAVAYLAMAELPERICACDNANRTLYRYQQQLNHTGADQNIFAVTREQLNNPLGTRWGDWYAWNEIKSLRLVRGAS